MKIVHGFIPQKGPQLAFVTCPADIVVYGGARGGGKSYATLGEFWLHAQDEGHDARGLMVRRSREDLKDTIETAMNMYGSAAVWNDQKKVFRFKSGAFLHMAYLETDADAMNYQGWSLTRVYVEELTQYPSPKGIFKLFATLRSNVGIRCQFRATCNPGGPGHHWVKQWVIDPGPITPVKDPDTGLIRVFIPAKLADNPALLRNDPNYVNRLKASGSPELVRAWLEGDWNVIEGAFFPEFTEQRHVIRPFPIPEHWVKFRSGDWGSAVPYSFGWWAVVQDDHPVLYAPNDTRILPRGAIVRYRELYGASGPNIGLKQPAEEVARIVKAWDAGDDIAYGVLDPSAFAVQSGPSIGEVFARAGVYMRPADNVRLSTPKRMGGWDQVRARLRGNPDGEPMLYVFSTCRALIRTIPMMQHDEHRPEDLDTETEDHAMDDCRYACMSRPFTASSHAAHDDNPYLVANAFRLHELH
jgi:Terminase large subunit, T4likevirus-type, N-terminal